MVSTMYVNIIKKNNNKNNKKQKKQKQKTKLSKNKVQKYHTVGTVPNSNR